MEENKGRYLRPEHDPDDDLRAIGVNITDRTRDIHMDAETEVVEGDTCSNFLNSIKYPALFLGLTVGIGVCEYLGLMAEVKTVNVPWAEGAVASAPWGAATVNYNYTGA